MKLDSLGLKYVQWLSRTFNESQREAITAAATSEGFTLIKGPPGTGKTTTLKGLLNSLHLREYNRYYNAVLDVARRPDNETAKAWAQVGNEKPHILVTAPSNAAVDNIVSKVIEEGFCDGEGRRYFPKIVRVGRGLSANVQSVGLENQVDQICSQPLDVLEGHIGRLRHELMRDSLILRDQLRNIVAWIEHDPVKALEEIAQAEAQQHQWGPIDYSRYQPYVAMAQRINGCLEKLSEVKLELQRYEFARQAVSEMRGKLSQSTRQSLEVSFLDTAHIVFTTLSSAGVAALDASHRYDVLVVDEAAQAVELSSIIPMKFGSKQCVLVGDPQQLSATVFSRNSGQSLYERSLFERLESCEHPVHMLRTQYRSHPMISDFPRNYFYDGKLQDGENVKGDDYVKPYHSLGPAFLPLVFWNLLSSREKATKSVSRMNVGEAELAVNLYLTLKNSCPPDAIAGKVGMITPYSQQMEELRSRFRRTLGERYEQEVEINTVDGFQGREKDIIILSTVRADPKAGVGFLNDIRRMNVALTRAKFACYVIGKENTLRSSKPWSALLDHAYNHHCIVHV
eukprot:jgi/Phyca11/557343/estExt2_Genewise1Plus.C_PHYCAscaffold_1070047